MYSSPCCSVAVKSTASTASTDSTVANKAVDITSIRELRLGQSPTDTYDSKRWLTIVYVRGSVWKVMHLIAHTDDVYDLWVSALQGLVSQSSDKVVSGAAHGPATDPDLLFIRQLWPAGQKTLNEAAAKGLCGKLGLDLTPEALKRYQVSPTSSSLLWVLRVLRSPALIRSACGAGSEPRSRWPYAAIARTSWQQWPCEVRQ